MKVTITDAVTLRKLRPLDVAVYLRAKGWEEADRIGEKASVWRFPQKDAVVVLVMKEELGDYAIRMGELLLEVARVEGRAQNYIFSDMMTSGDQNAMKNEDANSGSPLPGSTVRHAKPPFQGQRGRCAWCGTAELPKGRSSWCSQKCVAEYLSRSRPDHIRRQVYQRDKGICGICGCDSDAEYKAWSDQRKEVARLADKLVHAARWNVDWSGWRMNFRDTTPPPAKEAQKFREMMLAKYAPGTWTKGRSTGWDADHIVPVVEGGGECDLSNYRTLCHPCHKVVTAELAARRAEARRIEKRRASGDLSVNNL